MARFGLAAFLWCCLAPVLPMAPLARAAERTAQSGQLVEKDGLYYVAGETAPFTGVVRDSDETGKPRVERRFAAGKTVAVRQWRQNGSLASETVIEASGLTRKLWYDNGNPEEQTQVVIERGEKVSEHSAMYYEDGKPRLEIGYRHEALQGALREYAPDGSLVRDETYDQGKLTRKSK
ncbi:MAG: hypothetical protein HQK81_07235 [Desulfovibrionaceae bacterium]|nr:hypothetical protein [Desulfovibrionaceae bacterium]MBF0513845.1 hypothetical protein [Desulfovibrionaceae bacterium]